MGWGWLFAELQFVENLLIANSRLVPTHSRLLFCRNLMSFIVSCRMWVSKTLPPEWTVVEKYCVLWMHALHNQRAVDLLLHMLFIFWRCVCFFVVYFTTLSHLVSIQAVIRFKMAVFWDCALCSLAEMYHCHRSACCLHHEGENALMMVTVNTSEAPVNYY